MEALLNALAYERGRYKQASEALHNAHETVLTLEAQVARREAELETRDHQHIVDVKPIPPKRKLVEALHPNLPEVPLSEVVHSLSIAGGHNHVLEQEVHELRNRVSRPLSLKSFSKATAGVRERGISTPHDLHRLRSRLHLPRKRKPPIPRTLHRRPSPHEQDLARGEGS